MRTISCALFTVAVVIASACGATTRSGSTPSQTATAVLTGSTVSFRTLDNGKDTNSQVTVQLMRSNHELGAELHVAGTKFDDNTQSAPMALAISGPFRLSDVNDGSLRIRMNPDGRDTWTFDMRLVLTFSDNTQRTFAWQGIRLDENAPERTLPLAPARVI
jgi:ABC-type transport system substrate-binding protein